MNGVVNLLMIIIGMLATSVMAVSCMAAIAGAYSITDGEQTHSTTNTMVGIVYFVMFMVAIFGINWSKFGDSDIKLFLGCQIVSLVISVVLAMGTLNPSNNLKFFVLSIVFTLLIYGVVIAFFSLST